MAVQYNEKATKYYYGDKLIRTSKRVYTHAVINAATGNLHSCHNGKAAAEKEIGRYISENQTGIANATLGLKALEAGKTKVRYTYRGGYSYYEKVESADFYKKWIRDNEANIEYIRNNWKIVEIEAR